MATLKRAPTTMVSFRLSRRAQRLLSALALKIGLRTKTATLEFIINQAAEERGMKA